MPPVESCTHVPRLRGDFRGEGADVLRGEQGCELTPTPSRVHNPHHGARRLHKSARTVFSVGLCSVWGCVHMATGTAPHGVDQAR